VAKAKDNTAPPPPKKRFDVVVSNPHVGQETFAGVEAADAAEAELIVSGWLTAGMDVREAN